MKSQQQFFYAVLTVSLIVTFIFQFFFLPYNDLDKDWCARGEDVISGISDRGQEEYEFLCYEFKNSIEQTKYETNNKLETRQGLFFIGLFIVNVVVFHIFFYFIEKKQDKYARLIFSIEQEDLIPATLIMWTAVLFSFILYFFLR